MARFKIDCCLNCEKRDPYCHSTCDDYKKERAEMDETTDEVRRKKEIESGIKSSMIDSMDRNNKRTHYRRRRGYSCGEK